MTTPPCQMLVFIGSDGKRATVSRAIATEASYVLRDLLDGYEDLVAVTGETGARTGIGNDGKGETAPRSQATVPDLMDFFRDEIQTHDEVTSNATTTADKNTSSAASIELPFPYFTGDILERVCAHMVSHFKMSTFGVQDGVYRVYPVKTREIPKPMTLPLTEYLDPQDRRLIADWDEKITVWMVKAATLLNYDELLQLASAKLASYMNEKSVEGLRILLGVENDFNAAEEAELKKEQILEMPK